MKVMVFRRKSNNFALRNCCSSMLRRFKKSSSEYGKVLEWLKRHAWKACNRQNRFGGSNPPLSAKSPLFKGNLPKVVFDTFSYFWVKLGKINRRLTAKTANKPQH